MARFRKKPVVIEAIQYEPHANCAEVAAFLGQAHAPEACRFVGAHESWLIDTLEGQVECRPGDWIIKGAKGECYPCKPDIFAQTYEPV